MAIHLRCPNCGSRIEVSDEYAGRRANCPACWDPVRVPYVSILESAPPGDGQHPPSPKPLEPVSGLVFDALKSSIRHPSRPFIAGVAIILGLMFVFCGGLGTIKSLFSPSETKKVAPKTEFDEPAELREMSSDLEELRPKEAPVDNRK
jgi:hypothetical protein